MYEGDYTWRGEPEGRGTERWDDGKVYEGEFGGGYEGWLRHDAACQWRGGSVLLQGGRSVGEGVGWTPTGKAHRMRDGKRVEQISLEEAPRIAAEVGLPVPDALPKHKGIALLMALDDIALPPRFRRHQAHPRRLWKQSVFLRKLVKIVGLQGRPELNGRVGTRISFDAAKGRYKVKMAEDEILLVISRDLDPTPAF